MSQSVGHALDLVFRGVIALWLDASIQYEESTLEQFLQSAGDGGWNGDGALWVGATADRWKALQNCAAGATDVFDGGSENFPLPMFERFLITRFASLACENEAIHGFSPLSPWRYSVSAQTFFFSLESSPLGATQALARRSVLILFGGQ